MRLYRHCDGGDMEWKSLSFSSARPCKCEVGNLQTLNSSVQMLPLYSYFHNSFDTTQFLQLKQRRKMVHT
jgi:hypothetical protein